MKNNQITRIGSESISKLKFGQSRIDPFLNAKMKGFLFGFLLIATGLPVVAQSETTITTTTQAPAVPVVQPQPATTQSVTTTKVSTKTRMLYLRDIYHGSIKHGSQVFVRPNGRIYDQDGDYVGHLTDLNGDDIKSIPSDRRYKIRNKKGTIIASTRLTNDFDSGRTIILARQDINGNVIAETVETTNVTTVPVVPPPVQASTTVTTTQSAPVQQTPP